MNDKIKLNLNERGWEQLMLAIEKGDVVPIFGSELFCIEVDGKCVHIDKYIVNKIAQKYNIEHNNSLGFIDLSKILDENSTDFYYETNIVLRNMCESVRCSNSLEKLLSIDKFKLILTTSYDNLIFKEMEKKWGVGKVKQLTFIKGTGKEDIELSDINKPVLYHVFGKANPEEKSYVLTDDDLLEFVPDWLNENYRPKNLYNILQDKYLLVIGCDYPNWLFRFFLYSVKSFKSTKRTTIAHSKLNDELLAFLSRIKVETHNDAISFIDELLERWEKYKIEEKTTDKKDIFISYASEDYEKADEIYKKFEKLGASVWFDKKELEPSDEFAKKIHQNIRNSRIFVPILSKNTLITGSRFFKKEWNWALEENKSFINEKFIYPIIIEKIDINCDALPEEFKDKHYVDFQSDNFENDLKKIVRDIRLKQNNK